MPNRDVASLRKNSPYSAAITREQFLFYEMRTTAQLVDQGLSHDEIINQITSENLFQYPTEKSVRKMAFACLRRLDALEDQVLVHAIAVEPSSVAKQVCLYAMMKQYQLVWEFMTTVVGAKYRTLDSSFARSDLNAFFLRLQEQDDGVATWSESTITKVKQVLMRILVENEYLDSPNANRLNPVLLSGILESRIQANGDTLALSAFNYVE